MKALLLSVLVGFGFAACGGRVTTVEASDAATDTAAIDAPTSTTTSPTTTTTSTPTTPPPTCPTYRPLKGVPCTRGLSCFFACAPGYASSLRATCPDGQWVLENVAACD